MEAHPTMSGSPRHSMLAPASEAYVSTMPLQHAAMVSKGRILRLATVKQADGISVQHAALRQQALAEHSRAGRSRAGHHMRQYTRGRDFSSCSPGMLSA